MKTKTAILLLALIMLAAFALGAVGIAQLPGGDNENTDDRFAGVLLSKHSFSELFGTDSERVYAELDGDTLNAEYRFPCAPGAQVMSCFVAIRGDTMVGDTDKALTDVMRGYTVVNDDAANIDISATLYVSTSFDGEFIYAHRVYQTGSGKVYAVAGQAVSVPSSGGTFSTKLEETTESIYNGARVQTTTTADIKLEVMSEPTRVAILQFDKNGALLDSVFYDPAELPEELNAETGAEYIVVETTAVNCDGQSETTREVVSKTDDGEGLRAFYCRDDGVCVRKTCIVNWGA